MTAPSCTPGPWDFACDSYGNVRHSRKACVFQSGVGAITSIAARIPNWSDARLIAAAPELYAALKAMVDIMPAKYHEPRIDAARAAIAKAEGR